MRATKSFTGLQISIHMLVLVLTLSAMIVSTWKGVWSLQKIKISGPRGLRMMTSSASTASVPVMTAAASFLEGLNENQKMAVKALRHCLFVHSWPRIGEDKGPYSSHRLPTRRFAKRGSILAITFTNKAAAEMRQRLERLIVGAAGRCTISTFHSFCQTIEILRC